MKKSSALSSTLGKVLPHIWPRGHADIKTRVILAMLCLVTAKIANVFVPIFFKQIVNSFTHPVATIIAVPVGLFLAYGAARILSQGFSELRDALFAPVAQRAIRKVALETFEHLHNLSLRFHLDRRTGSLARIIDRGAKGIEFLSFFLLFNIVPTILEIAMVAGILWWLFGWSFAGVTVATIGIYIVFTLKLTDWRIGLRREMNEADQEAAGRAVDALLNYETVKYFNNETFEAGRYDRALGIYERASVKSRVSLSFLNIGQAIIISIGTVALMVMVAWRISHNVATVGDLVMVTTYLTQLYLPLNFLGTVYREIRQALIDMEAMIDLLQVDVEVRDTPGAPALSVPKGDIRFENVVFGYDKDRPILKGVSFHVEPGKTVAIVGPSGAGKSTISRLLFRFFEPQQGRILIDDQDINLVAQSSLRGSIGIVPQDTVLFNDTIGYNIRYGQPDAAPEEVVRAAELAHIGEFIDTLPEGYETRVGERGLKLSGGEKQRVAIARTILKRPRILLFDEATSALDSRTEKEIQANLRDVSRGISTLIIAHRLSTIIDAHQILVLEDGKIVERGTHQNLLAQNGLYATMWHRQLEQAPAQ
ncbi:MAG TPA: ABC transporter ATP-binding protein/permease [Dongiaceae bacterium]|jgi:ATP-binding cassette subfamily B protein|nr:ABC transporter ATP-binding protein/permease [Dongiaceae bacterium]